MISFIVIGKNEAKNLNRCFKSIIETISYNKLSEYEIIYIDSNSTDNSIEIAQSFSEIKIFKITGIFNAAIARNIGAKESKGNVLFFIDGDMEIIPEFLPMVYSKNYGLRYNFVSGQFIDYYYDDNGRFLHKAKYYGNLRKERKESTTGGLFLIKNETWKSVNGMNTKYKRNQDFDLALRLSKKGVKLLRKKELLARHYTISYNDSRRMWKMLFNGSTFFRVVLLRDHYKNLDLLKVYFRSNYTSILLFFSILVAIFFKFFFLIIIYFTAIFLRSVINMKRDIFHFPSRFIYFLFHDTAIWFALLLFWPKEVRKVEYIEIKRG